MSGAFFVRVVSTLTAPIARGLDTRTVILAPGRSVVPKGVSAMEPARVLRTVFFRGHPLPARVATSVASDGTPVTPRWDRRVDEDVAWAKNASVIVSRGGAPEPPEEPVERPAACRSFT